MTKDNNNGLIHRPTTEITKQGGGTSPVIARMSQDVLDRANARFRLGKYLLRGPDYNQILLWAEAMEMSPEQVLEHLSVEDSVRADGPWSGEMEFLVQYGSITSLCWDFRLLPLRPNVWLDGLRLRTLSFTGNHPESSDALAPSLAQLERMYCRESNLTQLNLSAVPMLTELACGYNQLATLDLSLVPELTALGCYKNQLTTLDLALVPKLSMLACFQNQLTSLDLSRVPELTVLNCWSNQLTILDLSLVPKLTKLHCDESVQVLNAPEGLEIEYW